MSKSYINLTKKQYLFLIKLRNKRILEIKTREDYLLARSLYKKLPFAIEMINNYVYLKTDINIKDIKVRKTGTIYLRV